MNTSVEKIPVVYLKPGEMFFSDTPAVVVTVLGSCLSVTMFCRKRGLGGICHGLMPTCKGRKDCNGDCLDGFKYVNCSIQRMVKIFDHYKVRRSDIEVKCFGGSDMFSRQINRPDVASIGRQNILSAEEILRSEGLKTINQDLGGLQGRKIVFYTHTGEVLLKRLKKMDVVKLT